jgi:hypothetical protein
MAIFRFKLLVAALIGGNALWGQNTDSLMLRKIHDEVLVNGMAHDNLRVLCKTVGARLSGSAAAQKAIVWGEKTLRAAGADSVWLEPILVPQWVRGQPEQCTWGLVGEKMGPAPVLALGGSEPTGGRIKAPVVWVKDLESLKSAAPQAFVGKIVFLAQAMDPRFIDTFNAYGTCATIRINGASIAAEKGAVALVIRSLTLAEDEHPHTGVVVYKEGAPRIPCAALATADAQALETKLQQGKNVLMTLEMTCKNLPDVPSFNVVGEIRGQQPSKGILLVGGHLDSWDVGEGAHDDGAGCVQSIEVLRTFKALGYKPQHSIRAVLFMNEENGNRGGLGYAEKARTTGLKHVAALESDRGGFAPRGFSLDASPAQRAHIQAWMPLLKPYLLHLSDPGYGGVDINPLRDGTVALMGLVPDSQRYFDFHHAATDVFEAVHPRELHLGAAAMASLIYLLDAHPFTLQ